MKNCGACHTFETLSPVSSPFKVRLIAGSGRVRGLLLTLCLGLGGCRSRFVEVTIVNQGPAMHVMEFDYPSASFGANLLATGANYHYRFKVQGPGPLSLQYEDASGHSRTVQGPKVELGDQGSLLVKIDEGGSVSWSPNLSNPK